MNFDEFHSKTYRTYRSAKDPNAQLVSGWVALVPVSRAASSVTSSAAATSEGPQSCYSKMRGPLRFIPGWWIATPASALVEWMRRYIYIYIYKCWYIDI
jgi:hypothetical protein